MEKYQKDIAFLGRGWSFPPTFSLKKTEAIAMVDAREIVRGDKHIIPIIERSIEIIISTFRGTRVMQPTFGSNLTPFLFENVNLQNTEIIKRFIQEAVTEHEPRVVIDMIDIQVDTTTIEKSNKISINVFYYIIGSNTRYNYVFPFYQPEGSNIANL
jgi:uncharacterized protein